jgi:hypothetical protein
VLEGDEKGLAPRALVARMVDLVEDHDGVLREARKSPRRRCDLLVGRHDAVHVWRESDSRRPPWVEVEIEGGCRASPLEFEVSGRDYHHETAGVSGEKLSRGSEGERGLSCTWRRDGEKVAPRSFAEPLERRALPGT